MLSTTHTHLNRRQMAPTGTMLVLATVLAMLVSLVLAASPVMAAKAPLTLELSQKEGRVPNSIDLIAKVTNESGRPVGMQTVEFYMVPDFFTYDRFGPRLMLIDDGRTNVVGTAKATWMPKVSGDVKILVRAVGDSRFAKAESEMMLTLPAAAPTPKTNARPLRDVRVSTGTLVRWLTLGVWLLLIGLAAETVFAIWRAAQKEGLESEVFDPTSVGNPTTD